MRVRKIQSEGDLTIATLKMEEKGMSQRMWWPPEVGNKSQFTIRKKLGTSVLQLQGNNSAKNLIEQKIDSSLEPSEGA